jgi:hypothetical protein
MIRVTVEMFPQGDENRKYSLGHFDIYNTGLTMNKRRGDYGVRFFSKTGADLPGRKGVIGDWPRLSRPVMSLVRKALETVGF